MILSLSLSLSLYIYIFSDSYLIYIYPDKFPDLIRTRDGEEEQKYVVLTKSCIFVLCELFFLLFVESEIDGVVQRARAREYR